MRSKIWLRRRKSLYTISASQIFIENGRSTWLKVCAPVHKLVTSVPCFDPCLKNELRNMHLKEWCKQTPLMNSHVVSSKCPPTWSKDWKLLQNTSTRCKLVRGVIKSPHYESYLVKSPTMRFTFALWHKCSISVTRTSELLRMPVESLTPEAPPTFKSVVNLTVKNLQAKHRYSRKITAEWVLQYHVDQIDSILV